MNRSKNVAKIWREPIQGYDPWRNSDKYTFDSRKAARLIKFFETNFKHSKGEFAGKPFKLEKWQKQIIGHIFGWTRKDGTRRYRKAFILIPRKNGKTQIAAAFGLLLFVADNEPGAEIYSLAADTEQASLVYKEACQMVKQNPALSQAIKVYGGYKAMKFEATQSYWKVLSSEAGTKHGLNPHGYIVDEVHAQKHSELMEVIETGTGARRQPLGIYLTTSDYAGLSPCNTLVDYSRKVRDGILDDGEFFPVLYEAIPEKDDWKDERTWWKVNPNLGVSLKLDYLRSQFRKAMEEPAFENTFKRLHLNMQTEQERRWLKMEDWDASGQRMEKSELLGRKCYGGLDLSSTTDISAFVLYFPDFKACLPWFWVPMKTAKKRMEYELWERQGYLSITEGPIIDPDQIRRKIKELSTQYKITSIGYDPWNASQISKRLSDDEGLPMVEFRQGFVSMNEPAKELEKLVVNHDLVHFANPVLRWMASNAQVKEDPSGNIKPTKPGKDSPSKIDGIVALTMAVGLGIGEVREVESIINSDNLDNVLKEIYGR